MHCELIKLSISLKYKTGKEKEQIITKKSESWGMCGPVVGINHVRPQGFTRGNFTQQSRSHAQGHRNKNIFCELASQEWELGMCVVVAEEVGVRLGSDCPVSKRAAAASRSVPSPPC